MGSSQTELMAIVSEPKDSHMYHGENFAFLMDVVDNLTISVCNRAKRLGRNTSFIQPHVTLVKTNYQRLKVIKHQQSPTSLSYRELRSSS